MPKKEIEHYYHMEDWFRRPVETLGKSPECAITVNEVQEEYEWIQRNYPGARVHQQALCYIDGRQYDVISFSAGDSKKHTAYFDITEMFAKYGDK